LKKTSRSKLVAKQKKQKKVSSKVSSWRAGNRHVLPGRDTPGFAKFRAFFNDMTPPKRERFAEQCKTTVFYINRVLAMGRMGRKMAEKVEKASGGVIPKSMVYVKNPLNRTHDKRHVSPDRDTPGFAMFRSYFNDLSKEDRQRFAVDCETTVDYIRKTLNRGVMGPEMAMKIERASNQEITRDMLYPEWRQIWDEVPTPKLHTQH